MVADYFTKPLQGELFYKYRDQIMGLVPMGTITGDHRSVLDKKSPQPKVSSAARQIDARKRPMAKHATKHPSGDLSWADAIKSKPQSSPITRRLTQLV
jgi:hypothetical protein